MAATRLVAYELAGSGLPDSELQRLLGLHLGHRIKPFPLPEVQEVGSELSEALSAAGVAA